MPYIDRKQAGKVLGKLLADLPWLDPVVLALPRGGVPVGYQVALALGAPLDIIVVRKLGVPFQPELAMGAIGEDGVRVLDKEIIAATGATEPEIFAMEAKERAELDRRVRRYRSVCPRIPLPGRTAIVVDDGIATGSTARAACLVARAHGAAEVIVAAPVASRQAVALLREVADRVIAVEQPEQFYAVGQWYLDFRPTTDSDLLALLTTSECGPTRSLAGVGGAGLSDLQKANDPVDPPDRLDPPGPPGPTVLDRDVQMNLATSQLNGHLTAPEGATGLVVFVHGSGSSRHSPRNRFVARVLNQAGLATLLFDLLTPEEELLRTNVFDIDLLGGRLAEVTRWLVDQTKPRRLGIGYFGASTGSAAALWAAADGQLGIGAVVSRGGRPDLAASRLSLVAAPTLLIVGEQDKEVLELNRRAQLALTCENRLTIVPGATHLFEEPGTLQVAADLAANWFTANLSRNRRAESTGPHGATGRPS